MNLLTISLMSSCNRSCYYCPTRKWHVPVEDKRDDINIITNKALFEWADAHIDPDKWILEITGGEPGLYPEIDTLIPGLCSRFKVILIKTNGSLPIPAGGNVVRVAAWHEGVEELPQYYDQILIIRNLNDDYAKKIRYCKDRNIPYKTVMFDNWYETKKPVNEVFCRFNHMVKCSHVNSSGQITACARVPPDPACTIFNMSAPPVKDLTATCPKCKNVNDVELFLSDELKTKLKADYDNYLSGGGTNE